MAIYFSKTKGFLDDLIHSEIPDDAVCIAEEQYIELINAQANGKNIKTNADGTPEITDSKGLTDEQNIKIYKNAVKNFLDSIAKSWGYDSIISAVSYANSTNGQYKEEAEKLIAWRDLCWQKAYTVEAEGFPANIKDFVAMLPPAPTKPIV
jgi:hypothetical protein